MKQIYLYGNILLNMEHIETSNDLILLINNCLTEGLNNMNEEDKIMLSTLVMGFLTEALRKNELNNNGAITNFINKIEKEISYYDIIQLRNGIKYKRI